MSIGLAIVLLVVGLVVLIAGAEALVRGAAQLATQLGLSHFAIGVTVVAFGTSAPEMFACIGAALQDAPGLAVGNVVGSNIANILLILGVGALIAPIAVHRRVRTVELPILIGITFFATVLMLDQYISRLEGALLTVGLVGYIFFIIRAHKEDIEHGFDETAKAPKTIKVDLLLVLLGVIGLGLGARALVVGVQAVAALGVLSCSVLFFFIVSELLVLS